MPVTSSTDPAQPHNHSSCISFDYGLRRIGVAVGNESLQTARPLTVVSNNNGTPDWASIDKLIATWQPAYIVLGWPLTLDGNEQAICTQIKGFAKRLRSRFSVEVHFTDERFSSIAAQDKIRQMRSSGQRRKRTQKGDIDSVAAAIILESWFARELNTP